MPGTETRRRGDIQGLRAIAIPTGCRLPTRSTRGCPAGTSGSTCSSSSPASSSPAFLMREQPVDRARSPCRTSGRAASVGSSSATLVVAAATLVVAAVKFDFSFNRSARSRTPPGHSSRSRTCALRTRRPAATSPIPSRTRSSHFRSLSVEGSSMWRCRCLLLPPPRRR